jgi:FtsH-binding integral membrane protein
MADDQEQRGVEAIKLRIAFLQHIATLSGAAIVIILALIQRAETAREAHRLESTIPLFLLAVLGSLLGVTLLIIRTERAGWVQASAGRFTTLFASALFLAGVTTAAYSAAGVPERWWWATVYALAALGTASLLYGILLRRRMPGAPQAPTGGTESEDNSEGRGEPQAATSRPWWRRLFGG